LIHFLKVVHSDSGSVFLSKEFQAYCLRQGILQDVSAPYSHQHNLVEGSCIRVVINRARVLLADAGLPARFAGYAVQESIRTWNEMLHPLSAWMTPVERVTGKKLDISGNRPFGAICFYFNSKKVRELSDDSRWRETASKGILLGRAPGVQGGYLVYPGHNRGVLVRNQVVVMEAKDTAALPCYSDRFLLGEALLTEEETIPQTDQAARDAEDRVPVASGTRAGSKRAQRAKGPVQDADWVTAHPSAPEEDYWSSACPSRAEAGIGS
jgi:hypothetical protein